MKLPRESKEEYGRSKIGPHNGYWVFILEGEFRGLWPLLVDYLEFEVDLDLAGWQSGAPTSGSWSTRTPMLIQGIACRDQTNFQIVRIRPVIGLNCQTTEVNFIQVSGQSWLQKGWQDPAAGQRSPGKSPVSRFCALRDREL